jgi:hypothetical protein
MTFMYYGLNPDGFVAGSNTSSLEPAWCGRTNIHDGIWMKVHVMNDHPCSLVVYQTVQKQYN